MASRLLDILSRLAISIRTTAFRVCAGDPSVLATNSRQSDVSSHLRSQPQVAQVVGAVMAKGVRAC